MTLHLHSLASQHVSPIIMLPTGRREGGDGSGCEGSAGISPPTCVTGVQLYRLHPPLHTANTC